MAGFFDTMFGGGAEADAAEKNRALYQQYQQQGSADLAQGYKTGTENLNKALGAYQPLSDLAGMYRKGSGLALDALGINGPEGNTRATTAFQTGPGYQFSLDQGLDAINRRRATSGMLNSGNADIDALKFGQGLANQEYGGWLSNLLGVDRNALSATGATASGQAGVYGGLADLARGYSNDQVGLLGNTTSGMAGANNFEAAGKAAGAKNLLGAGLGLASLGAGGGFGSALGAGANALGSAAFSAYTNGGPVGWAR